MSNTTVTYINYLNFSLSWKFLEFTYDSGTQQFSQTALSCPQIFRIQ